MAWLDQVTTGALAADAAGATMETLMASILLLLLLASCTTEMSMDEPQSAAGQWSTPMVRLSLHFIHVGGGRDLITTNRLDLQGRLYTLMEEKVHRC